MTKIVAALSHLLEIRVGIPRPGGALAAAARALGYKVMVSANSFLIRDKFGEPMRVRPPGATFAGLDAALDSGGYVGMARYGCLPFPYVEEYVLGVAAAYPWAWYAQPDYCCEPKIAASRSDVRFRQAATVALFLECTAVAARAGLPGPIPVVQGWMAEDYQRCWDMLPLHGPPPLVGVGSVCARPVHGPSGLMSIVHRIDRVLPPGVQIHLFGVKSGGIRAILSEACLDGRVRSVDSMAWDFAARMRFRTGRTIARRVGFMRAWHDRQVTLAAGAAASAQASLFGRSLRAVPAAPAPDDPALEEIVDLLAGAEIDLRTACRLYEHAMMTGDAPLPVVPARARHQPSVPSSQVELALAA